MASKGPKSAAPVSTVKPVVKPVAAAPAAKSPANLPKTPVTATPVPAPVGTEASPAPVVAKATPAPAPAPVVAKAAPAPVVAKAAPAPVVAKAAPAPVVAKPRPAPVKAKAKRAPTPVSTATVPTPTAAPAAATLQKEAIMETTIKAATDKLQAQAKTLFGDANDRTKTAMEKGSKMFEDMNDFSKGNVEALVESSKIAAKGAEEIAKYTTDYFKATVEKANAAAKQFAAIKSPTELFTLQSEHAKSAMDTMMAETAKFTENYMKLMGEIAQPISNRVAVAAEKIKIAA